jgi:hypothetical protein
MPLLPHTRIRSRYPFLSDDEELNFKLILGENSICSKGRVVRSESLPGKRTVSDIEFIELSEQNLATLQNYLTTQKEWPKRRGMRSVGEKAGDGVNIIKARGK